MAEQVLILGALSDIAKATAARFAQEGAHLMLAARDASRLQPMLSDLQIRHKVEVQAVEFDALATDQHADFYATLSPKPDVVVCVFGYLGDQTKAEQDATMADKILRTNYNGAVSILSIAANEMEHRGNGQIIGISSVAGDRGRGSNYFYGSAKAGFTAFLSGLRNRLAGKGVHVMTVKPGFVRTAMTEGLDLPGPLTASADQVAKDLVRGLRKGKNVIYSLWMWRYIMLIIRNIPEGIFKKLKL